MSLDEHQRLQNLMNVMGIRAPITAAIVLQLICELRQLNVIDEGAVERIKDSGVRAAFSFRPLHTPSSEFETKVRELFDRLLDELDTSKSGERLVERPESG
jgi:hypothetical protein